MRASEFDSADPAARAEARLRAFERGDRRTRMAAAVTLRCLAAVAPFAAASLVDHSGATVGAVVGAVFLAWSAAALRPWEWSGDERRHHELTAIWAEARPEAGTCVPWDRYVAWARAANGDVELLLLRHAGSTDEPSPLSVELVRRVDADDVAEAAKAMEELRERALNMETRARETYLESRSAAERRGHEEALRRVDAAAEDHRRQAEAQMRRELAAEEAAERRAQADAVARALRRR